MIDDFNRAIETLSLNNNPDEMESSILNKRILKTESQKGFDQATISSNTGKSTLQMRRASTGQMDLDHYLEHSPKKGTLNTRLTNRLANKQTNLKSTSSIDQVIPSSMTTTQQLTATATVSGQQQQPDVETIQQTKELIAANSAIEQQLKKQQQILIQQQQQFLQIQIEQQRLQSQMQEQREQQKLVEEKKMLEEKILQQQKQQQQQIRSSSSNSEKVNREKTVAVNTEISQHDIVGHERTIRDKYGHSVTSHVMKQDKQVSTSITPPSSSHSTPTGQVSRSISQMDRHGASTAASSRMSGIADGGDSMRTRVTSASSSSSLQRRLPHTLSEENNGMPTSVTAYHQQSSGRPGFSAISISQTFGSNSPLYARKGRNMTNSRGLPTTSVTAVSSSVYPSSILSKKDTSRSIGTSSLNTLGYLDLDTKNVTFENDKKRRKLPTVPKEDDSISSILATRKLIKESLSGKCRKGCRIVC